jgi:hypothetical protein
MSRKFRLEFTLETPNVLDQEVISFFTKRILSFISTDNINCSAYKLSLTSAEEINKNKCLDVHEDFVL